MKRVITNKQHRIPIAKGISPLTKEQYVPMLAEVSGWKVVRSKELKKDFKLKDFIEALKFVNKVGRIAEREQHHPDINLHSWNTVTIILSTHAIGCLSENDFTLARLIDLATK